MKWKIDIAKDALSVRLDLRGLPPDAEVTDDDVLAELEAAEIALDETVEQRVSVALRAFAAGKPGSDWPLIVEGQAPENGRDAAFHWSPSCEPDRRRRELAQAAQEDRASHYEAVGIPLAGEGETIGVLEPATPGKAGRDVRGREIAPQPGVELVIEPGDNVRLAPDGKTYIAECGGQPHYEGKKLYVDPVVQVPGHVDFATGNVNYAGDLAINGDVKDLFRVTVGGSATVSGTIEAAVVETGKDLHVARGIAGKEKARINVGGNLAARYLSNAACWVQGDAEVESEIVNCHLNVGGSMTLATGAVHGGQVTAAGNITAPILGSPMGVRTIIRAGIDPFAEQFIADLEQEHALFMAEINGLVPQIRSRLQVNRGRADEKTRRMADELRSLKQKLETLNDQIEECRRRFAQIPRGLAVTIYKIIYPGVILHLGPAIENVTMERRGPIQLVLTGKTADCAAIRFRTPSEAK